MRVKDKGGKVSSESKTCDLDAFQKGYSSHIKLLRKYYGTGLSGKKKNAVCISWLSQRFCCIPHAQRWLPPSVIPYALPVLWRLLVCIILAPAETVCPLAEVWAAYHCCISSHIFLPSHKHPCSSPNPIQAVITCTMRFIFDPGQTVHTNAVCMAHALLKQSSLSTLASRDTVDCTLRWAEF